MYSFYFHNVLLLTFGSLFYFYIANLEITNEFLIFRCTRQRISQLTKCNNINTVGYTRSRLLQETNEIKTENAKIKDKKGNANWGEIENLKVANDA